MKRKARIDTPIAHLDDEETIDHYNAVLYEGMRSTINQVIEGTDFKFEAVHRDIDEIRQEIAAIWKTIWSHRGK